jgi:tetratricopeptide (TPR) repeat protein
MTKAGRSGKDVSRLVRQAAASLAQGRHAEAEAEARAALEIDPDQPDGTHLLGLACLGVGRGEEAAAALSRAVALNPENASYQHSLALAEEAGRRWPEAEAAARRAHALRPESVEHLTTLGRVLLRHGKSADAVPFLETAVDRDPASFAATNVLGMALEELGRTVEAEARYRRALEIGEAPEVYFNLGNVLRDQHRADEAIAAYDRAIEIRPDFAEAHVHAAFALLLKGDYPLAWREYEWRWRVPAFAGSRRNFGKPVWDGAPLAGRVLLLHAEQGFGDTLQFVRYAGVAAGTGGRVVLECQPALAGLMASAAGVDRVVAGGDPLPEFDCHAPLLSMPRLSGTTLETVPGNVPYLAADPTRVGRWRQRFAGHPGLNIGIAWQGTAERRGNPARACPLSAFKPLLENPEFRLYSLQKEIRAEDRPLAAGLTDLSGEFGDFTDTAAAIAALDLVVSIDTAVAHLAGALGRPTWLLLSTAGDWRWLMGRADSPWYPSIRIFRQDRPREWADVLDRVAAAAGEFRPARA